MNKQTVRSLLTRDLKSLDAYTINRQNKLINYQPIPDYIANHGITDRLLPEIIHVAINAFIEAAFIELLQDKKQRDTVAIANSILSTGPEEMFKNLPKNARYPSGINALLHKIKGLSKYIKTLPEIEFTQEITDVDKVIEYLVYQYGMNPVLDKEVLSALRVKNLLDVNVLAMIISTKRMTEPYFYVLAYCNRKDPLIAYREPNAITKYYYMSGITKEINDLLKLNITLNEVDLAPLYDSELAVNLSNIITYFQMYTITTEELSDIVKTTTLDQLSYQDLLIITLYIVLNNNAKYNALYSQLFVS